MDIPPFKYILRWETPCNKSNVTKIKIELGSQAQSQFSSTNKSSAPSPKPGEGLNIYEALLSKA